MRILRFALGAVLLSGALGWLVLRYELMPAIFVGAIVVLILVARRPQLGLYLVYFLDLLVDDSGADPIMRPFGALYGSVIHGAIITPIELLLLLTLVLALAHGILSHTLQLRAGHMGWLTLMFFAAIVYGLARGAATGGDTYIGLWEARYLLQMCFSYFLARTSIRSRRGVQILLALTLVGTGLAAVEGAYRRFAIVDTGAAQGDLVFGHEDAVFLSLGILLVLLQQIFGGPRWRRLVGLVCLPVLAFTLMASQRRAGMVGLMIDILVFAFVFLVIERKTFFKVVVPILLCGCLYFPLFWNNTSVIGQPARALRSQIQPDARDAGSDLYRKLEKVDVQATISSDPLLGIGFGREFLWVVPLPEIQNWPFWHYEPHHNVLWVWLKTGALGFTIFLALVGAAIARATRCATIARDPEVRNCALMVLATIVATLVYSYVDTGLVSARLMMVTGTLMGTLPFLDNQISTARRQQQWIH